MNPHSDEQGAIHTHMHTNDLACMRSCAHVHAEIHTPTHQPLHLLPQPTPHRHAASGEKRKCLFLRIEYSGMSCATLTLRMQNLLLCIHVERHKTDATIKNVISLPMRRPRLSFAENEMPSSQPVQTFTTRINRSNEIKDEKERNYISVWPFKIYFLSKTVMGNIKSRGATLGQNPTVFKVENHLQKQNKLVMAVTFYVSSHYCLGISPRLICSVMSSFPKQNKLHFNCHHFCELEEAVAKQNTVCCRFS